MKIWRKIKLYKNILIGLWTLNLFLVFTGLYFIVSHFGNYHQVEKNFKTLSLRVTEAESILIALDNFEDKQSWTGQDWLSLGQLQQRILTLGVFSPSEMQNFFESQKPEIEKIRQGIESVKIESLAQLTMGATELGQYRTEVILLSLASLLFGIALPLALIWHLKRKTELLHERIEKQVISGLKIWKDQSIRYTQEGASSQFWLEVVLLTLAQVGKEIDHPFAVYAVQLSERILRETSGNNSQNDLENKGHVS